MKKLLILLLPFVMLLLGGCEKKTYVVPNRTIIVDLPPSAWEPFNAGENYIANINLPEITNDFNERGAVLTYVSFGERTYEQLPQVYGGISYTAHTRPGRLAIELERAEGSGTFDKPSGVVTVKIVLVESEFD